MPTLVSSLIGEEGSKNFGDIQLKITEGIEEHQKLWEDDLIYSFKFMKRYRGLIFLF